MKVYSKTLTPEQIKLYIQAYKEVKREIRRIERILRRKNNGIEKL